MPLHACPIHPHLVPHFGLKMYMHQYTYACPPQPPSLPHLFHVVEHKCAAPCACSSHPLSGPHLGQNVYMYAYPPDPKVYPTPSHQHVGLCVPFCGLMCAKATPHMVPDLDLKVNMHQYMYISTSIPT